MKLAYYADTDSLHIDLAEHPSVESREVSEGIVLNYGADGSLVGIDIDNASRMVQLQRLILTGMQVEVERAPANTHCTRKGIYGFAPASQALLI